VRPLPEAVDVPLSEISRGEPYQIRVGRLDRDHLEALVVQCKENPASLPPVYLNRTDSANPAKYFVIDGHHEVEAHDRAGLAMVCAFVEELNDEQAIDLAWDRNSRNSKNLSLRDRIAHARRLSCRRPRIPAAEIARICGISRTTVWRHSGGVSGKQKATPHPIIAYLRRVALDPIEWDTADHAVREVRRAIPKDDVDDFAQRLGDAALATLAVAEELGFSQSPGSN
jgi:hypothetical protein